MIPLELRMDKNGLLYVDDDRVLLHAPLLIDHREISDNCYYPSAFYRLPSTDEYIVKYCYTCYTRKEISKIKEMLLYLKEKQKNIPDVDFPIGYFKAGRRLAGQIIKYYPNGVSCENIIKEKDINIINKYYAHDEDVIHNMFLLFNDVLSLVHEMFENGIYYTDTNPGNIVLDDNKVKLIDFDPYYVRFDNKDIMLSKVLNGYCYLLRTVLSKYNLMNSLNESVKDFDTAKIFTKRLEDNVRKGR